VVLNDDRLAGRPTHGGLKDLRERSMSGSDLERLWNIGRAKIACRQWKVAALALILKNL